MSAICCCLGFSCCLSIIAGWTGIWECWFLMRGVNCGNGVCLSRTPCGVVSVCTSKFNCSVCSVPFYTCKQNLLILKLWLFFFSFQRSSVCCPKNCEKCVPLYGDCNWWNETAKDGKWWIKLMWVCQICMYNGQLQICYIDRNWHI